WVERAQAYFTIKDENGWSFKQLCDNLNCDPSKISKMFAVFTKLDASLHPSLGDGKGKLSLRMAYALANLPPERQKELAARLIADELSIEGLEGMLQEE